MSSLRWGLLSTARINRLVIPAIRGSARSEIAAVASRTLDRANAYAAEWRIPRALGSYAALVDDPEIDVIYISLPNSLHVEWTLRCLDAGKHVLCEKPLALSVEDVDRVQAAATRAARVATEGFMYRHHPMTHTVDAVVRSGQLGPVRGFKGAFTFPLTREGDARLDPALGGGSLWDVGCYPVTYACLLAGAAPVDVFGWQHASAAGVDLAFAGMMRFADGSVAQFDSGFMGPFRTTMEVVGADATLRLHRPFKGDDPAGVILTRGDDTRALPFTAEPPFAGEIADMEAAALDGREPRILLSESRRTAAVLCALYESARNGRAAPVTER
jgi:D-xylose 1-dehydrogenase (NADP+, D-xylono-1,5-lactone-forming)